MKELVILVDEQNNEIGTMEKSVVHSDHTPLHRAFSLFLFNDHGELLLQQRAGTKKTWPLVWSNSCCGHPAPGESTEDAIRRRLKGELGITENIELQIILPKYRYRFERDGIVENEICPVHIGRYNGTPQINPNEVEAIDYMPWEKFLVIDPTDKKYSEWSVDEARLLTTDKKFQELWTLWYNK